MRILRTAKTFVFVVLPATALVASGGSLFGPAMHAQQAPATSAGLDMTALDKTVDACTDFYQYACGGWMATHPIPADQSSWGRANELDERNQATLRKILEDAEAHPKADPDSKKIGDFYASCMDDSAANQKGLSVVQPELDRINAMTKPADLIAEVARLHAMGVDALFGFGSQEDFKDSKVEMATFEQGGLGLPDRDYYLKDDAQSQELRKKYGAHVSKMLTFTDEGSDQADADTKSIVDLETALAKVSMDRVMRRDPANVYHKMTREELTALTPAFDWQAYLAAVKAPAFTALNVGQPDFFKGTDALIASTPMNVWKAYLRWHVLHSTARFLSAKIYDENFDFFGRTLTGAKEPRPRWKRCVQYTDESLGEALGRYYVDETFGAEGKARMLTMVNALEASLEKDIQGLDWMTADTKKQALVKLHAVTNKIGYPDTWRDYSVGPHRPRRFPRQSQPRVCVRVRARSRQDRQRRGQERVADDAADAERLLPPHHEQHQFPRGDPAAAVLRSRERRCDELRGDWRGDRPRADARLRRSGPAFRRRGQPARLVERGRLEGVREPRELRRRRVRQVRGDSRREAERPADARREHGRQRRRPHRTDGAAADGREQSAAAGRRPDDGSAVLHRVRAGLVPEPAARGRADARDRGSALAGTRARQRRRVEHAGIPESVLVQGGIADGESEHVPRLVGRVVDGRSSRTLPTLLRSTIRHTVGSGFSRTYFSSSAFNDTSARSHPLPITS